MNSEEKTVECAGMQKMGRLKRCRKAAQDFNDQAAMMVTPIELAHSTKVMRTVLVSIGWIFPVCSSYKDR